MVRPKPVLLFSLVISLTCSFLVQAQTKSVTATNVASEDQPPNSTAATSVPVPTSERSAKDQGPTKAARENARRYYKAGVKYGRANLFKQALQSFQEALKNDPEYPEALYGLGRANLDLITVKQSKHSNPRSSSIQTQPMPIRDLAKLMQSSKTRSRRLESRIALESVNALHSQKNQPLRPPSRPIEKTIWQLSTR